MDRRVLTIYEETARCAYCGDTFRAQFFAPDAWLCLDCVERVDRMDADDFLTRVARTHRDLASGRDFVEIARRIMFVRFGD